MNNVIPITHSKLEIIPLRPKSSFVSPLKNRDSIINTRVEKFHSISIPNIADSASYLTKNNICIAENSSKKKIVLKKNRNFNSNKKAHF
jgi:hypothetical protein